MPEEQLGIAPKCADDGKQAASSVTIWQAGDPSEVFDARSFWVKGNQGKPDAHLPAVRGMNLSD